MSITLSLKTLGTSDFRDPKFFWHEESKQWILILVAGDHAEIYGSKDLKAWNKLSEFGKDYGSHGGVWECPDLFPLTVEGENTQQMDNDHKHKSRRTNGGSATQYSWERFDGKKFVADNNKATTLWARLRPDDYAGVTWVERTGQ
jgi:fructan beta-fructosidase